MKAGKIVIRILILTLYSCIAYSQNDEVKNTIEIFFEGFHSKDTLKLQSVCSNKIILQSIIENANGSKLTDESAKEFYNSITSIPNDFKFEERILSYSIQADGTMAHVWTPYEFYINGKLSHSGVNAFTLFKEQNVWKIIYVIDTRRK